MQLQCGYPAAPPRPAPPMTACLFAPLCPSSACWPVLCGTALLLGVDGGPAGGTLSTAGSPGSLSQLHCSGRTNGRPARSAAANRRPGLAWTPQSDGGARTNRFCRGECWQGNSYLSAITAVYCPRSIHFPPQAAGAEIAPDGSGVPGVPAAVFPGSRLRGPGSRQQPPTTSELHCCVAIRAELQTARS